MGILLGFLPFLAFAVLSILQSAVIGLVVGGAVSAGLIIRNRMRGGAPKILEIGTFILFVGLAIYAASAGRDFSVIAVRFCVDIGLLAIVVVSMVVRRPFTLQYAREQVAREHWNSERFVRTNYAITAAWAVAFLVMVLAEGAMLIIPRLPRSFGTIAIVAALLGGVWFTQKRSEASRAAAGQASNADPMGSR
jgi:hypothetical protein